MKKGLILIGIGFVLVYLASDYGMTFLGALGGVSFLAGCGMVGWNLDLGSKSSCKKNSETKSAPQQKTVPESKQSQPVSKPSSKLASQPAPAPAESAVKHCRYCGAKLEDGDIYCIECGERQ